MKLPLQIGLVVLGSTALIYLLTGAPGNSKARNHGGDQVTQPAPTKVVRRFELDHSFHRLTEQRIQHLKEQTEHRARTEAAVQEMTASRREAQLVTHAAWRQVVDSNFSKYQRLLERAKESPTGEEPCTICDGKSYMPCVMCKERDGRCITCGGTGSTAGDGYCPTCLGTKKCYLCTGSGKMFCPFCDDGAIKAEGRPPSSFPPGY